jgi:hypothetical protein
MKILENGIYRDMTESEIAEYEGESKGIESQELLLSYDEAVNLKIRERYTESQEFAILRQREEKPDEYAEYYAYCEECKAFVKLKKGVVS